MSVCSFEWHAHRALTGSAPGTCCILGPATRGAWHSCQDEFLSETPAFPELQLPARFSSPSSLRPRREAHPGGGMLGWPAPSPCRRRGTAREGRAAHPRLLPLLSPSSAPAPPVISTAKPIPVCLRWENAGTPGRHCSPFPRERRPSPRVTPAQAHRVPVPILSWHLGFILSGCPASPAPRAPRERCGKGCGRWWGGFLRFEGELQSSEPGLAKVYGRCLS